MGLLRAALLGILWLGTVSASAQTTLESYTRAKSALEASIAATPDDSVASLDALREAKRAFAPLGESLGSSLNEGLSVTFDNAERAVISASATDLKVQGAVLFGAFERSLYEAALRAAQDGNTAQARRLLNVLGQDLELRPARFSGPEANDDARALQFTFEKRLAARSLQQLQALRVLPQDARDARYEVLAKLYSHVFLIQDSPRLPEATQATVLGAIQALIAGRALEANLATLQGQLEALQQASTAAEMSLATVSTPNASSTAPADAADAQAAEPGGTATPETAETEPSGAEATEAEAVESEPGESEPAAETANAPIATAPTPSGAESAQRPAPTTTLEPTAAPETPTSADPTPEPPASETKAVSLPTAPDDTASPPLFSDTIGAYLLIAAGLLALVGTVLLLTQIAAFPALNIATILLLLPVLAEGLIALGAELAPLLGMPLLAQGRDYSLFTNPFTQSVWTLLVLLAGLVVVFTRRRAKVAPRAVQDTGPDPRAALEALPAAGTPSVPQLGSAGGFNWDEDF